MKRCPEENIERLKAETAHFQKLLKGDPDFAPLLEQLQQATTPAEMKDFLEDINLAFFMTRVDTSQSWLNLDKMGLTRLPTTPFDEPLLIPYWTKLYESYHQDPTRPWFSCADNYLRTIPAPIRAKMGDLFCDNILKRQKLLPQSRESKQWEEIQHFPDLMQLYQKKLFRKENNFWIISMHAAFSPK